MGTASYMSPEQALDAKDADVRSDIYSLGCTLYFMLTGNAPYARATTVQTIVAHREAEPPKLTEFRHDVTATLEVTYQKMVAKNPDNRHQSVEELRDSLRQLQSAEPSINAVHGSPAVAAVAGVESRRKRWIFVKTAILFALSSLFVAIMWIATTSPENPGASDAEQRDIARWALGSGGYVTAETEFGVQELVDPSEIPEGDFRITSLDLYAPDDSFDISPAMRLRRLQSLTLTDVKSIDLDAVSELTALRTLDIYGGNLGDADMARIAKLTALENLAIADCRLSDNGSSPPNELAFA